MYFKKQGMKPGIFVNGILMDRPETDLLPKKEDLDINTGLHITIIMIISILNILLKMVSRLRQKVMNLKYKLSLLLILLTKT